MKIYFIINPNAKNGRCQVIWRTIEKGLEEKGISFLAFFTEYPGHAREIAEAISKQADSQPIAIAAVGGDGTLHEVINGTAGYKNVSVGFIPGGSGNDFSRGFNIPKESAAALELFLREYSSNGIKIDTGKIRYNDFCETYFMNNMGVGFDAVIAREANDSGVKKLFNRMSLGRLVYAYILMKKLVTYRCVPIDLSVDGRKYEFDSAWFVTISNQPFFGGGMKISPGAKPADGLLDITVVHRLSRLKLLVVFISVFWGKHTVFKEVQQLRGRSISIESPLEILAHADGEVIGNTPLQIEVCPKSLRIISGNKHEGHTEELKIDDCH